MSAGKNMALIGGALCALLAAARGEVYAANIYVDSKQADDSGSGESWETAKKSIQAGIDISGTNDTVLVAEGTYQITSSLTIDNHIELRGATGDPTDVVVDAQGLCPCLVSLNKKQIIVNSITFENGYSATDSDVAGGITATDKSMVTNCIVRNCYHGVSGKTANGGGINLTTDRGNPTNVSPDWPNARKFLPQVADTLVENCAVYVEDANTERYARGGGVYTRYHNTFGLTVQDCAVTNFSTANSLVYTAGGGAYLSSGRHEGDVFLRNALENSASNSGFLGTGAGVCLSGNVSSGNIRRCALSDSLVSGNMSHGCGAGVGVGSYSTVDGCSVVSNRLSHVKSTEQYQIGGAGIYVSGSESLIANSLVAENISTNEANAAAYAGAVGAYDVTNTVIRDCVIRDNVLQVAGAFSFISAGGLLVSNCVMFGNVAMNEISAIRFRANQKDDANCAMSLIADCYIISNSNPRAASLTNGGGILNYTGAGMKNSYAAPLTVRNCLFAGNSAANGSRGWGVRATFGTDAGVSLVGDYMLTMDHCTFAKNANGSNYPNFVDFANDGSPEHVFFKGCAFWENRYNTGGTNPKLAYVSKDRVGAVFTNCYADVTNIAFVVTAENGNVGEGDVKFADAGNLDFRLSPGSCLVNRGGAFEAWMGDGRKNSVQDMGAGYVIGAVGKYGVTVGRRLASPRRYGSASDIGCCELWRPSGFILQFR